MSELSSEVTHNLWRNLQESSSGSLHLTVTINKCEVVSTQSTKTEISEDIKSQYVRKENISNNMNINLFQSLENTLSARRNVGYVVVEVLRARGLRSADFTGSSDPYATIELGNCYARTDTLYSTLDPTWNKTFTL